MKQNEDLRGLQQLQRQGVHQRSRVGICLDRMDVDGSDDTTTLLKIY
jgi:hypothetical protein